MYKRNRVYGNVEIYNGKLVAKGYSKKSCFDYEETFSPKAMIKSIIILLSIGVKPQKIQICEKGKTVISVENEKIF